MFNITVFLIVKYYTCGYVGERPFIWSFPTDREAHEFVMRDLRILISNSGVSIPQRRLLIEQAKDAVYARGGFNYEWYTYYLMKHVV